MGTIHRTENLKRGVVERSIRPSHHDEILRLWLQGQTLTEISKAVNVPRSTVHKFIVNELRPLARATYAREIGIFLSELTMLRAFAYRQVRESEKPLEEVRLEYDMAAAGASKEGKLLRKFVRRYPNLTALGWVGVIQWCLEQEARIAGHYRLSPPRRSQAKFRVTGGISPDQVTQEMCERLHAKLAGLRARGEVT